MLVNEPPFTKEIEKMRLVDLDELLMLYEPKKIVLPTKYKSKKQYKNLNIAAVLNEYIEEKKLKERDIRSCELEFIKKKAFEKHGEPYQNWDIVIPIPSNLLSPDGEISNSPQFVNVGDRVSVKWDSKDNPEQLPEYFNEMKGTIKKISDQKAFIVFTLNQRYWPPDSLNPVTLKRPKRITYKIQFLPNETIATRRLTALKNIKNVDPNIMNFILDPMSIEYNRFTTGEYISVSSLLTPSQRYAVQEAATNNITLIQGPPGCGKTFTIGQVVLANLENDSDSRILICGQTNQSINALLETVGKIVQENGFKMVWTTSKSQEFKSEKNLTPVQKYLTFYKMLHRKTIEGKEFRELVLKSWNTDLSSEEQERLETLRSIIEKNICKEANVVCSTLESAGKMCLSTLRFDTVIIDEATQAMEASTIIPLVHGARRIILVGDQKQLGPANMLRGREETHFYRSLYQRAFEQNFNRYIFLDRQFRMHPQISEFSSMMYYNDRLNDGVGESDRMLVNGEKKVINPFNDKNETPNHVYFFNVKGKEMQIGTSFTNEDEADQVVNAIKRLKDEGVADSQIGVITPYNAQVHMIRNMLDNIPSIQNIKVSSVDSYQGSERDYILISTVRTNNLGFVKDPRRLNVSITRARLCLAIFGNAKALSEQESDWRDFVEFTKDRNYFYEKYPFARQVKKEKQRSALLQSMSKIKVEERTKESIRFEIVNNFNGTKGFGLKEIRSTVGNSNVRLLWPDDENDVQFLKKWTQSRVNALDNGEFVTLSYDSESVCFQFGDIFDHNFDILQWNSDDEIPTIKEDEGIILLQYNQSNGQENNSLIEVIKPLLEHEDVTFITFDFTNDFEKLAQSGIEINTDRVIDCQMVQIPDGVNNKYIEATGWNSLKSSIQMLSDVDQPNSDMFQRAAEDVRSGKKDFPWDANKFMMKKYNYGSASLISKEFLEYSANDIFLTAVLCVNILVTDQLEDTFKESLVKLDEFRDILESNCNATDLRHANYMVAHYTVIMQGSFSENDIANKLLRKWIEFVTFDNLIKKEDDKIRNILQITDENKTLLQKKIGDIEKLIGDKKMDKVRSLSLLVALPK